MRVYLAGPMSGYPGHNLEAFTQAAADLRASDWDVVVPCEENPATNIKDLGWGWSDYLRADLKLVLSAQGVVVLPGWEASRGACLEVYVAQQLSMEVIPLAVALAR